MWLLFLVFLFFVWGFRDFFEEGRSGVDWRARFTKSGFWGLS